MISSCQLFRDIVRPCSVCEIPFDSRLHAPHVLPCSHTFCLMCLSKVEQRKKRHCFACKAKYSKFTPNLALIETIERLEERRKWFDCELRRCDECDNRVPLNMLRRCETCETQFVNRTDFPLECVVCLECCVNSHNGHGLLKIVASSSRIMTPSPSQDIAHHMSSKRSSVVGSVPNVHRQHSSTSSAVSVHFRPNTHLSHRLSAKGVRNGIVNAVKSWSFRSSANDFSLLLTPASKLAFSEEDIIMQRQSPFYDKHVSLDARRFDSSVLSEREEIDMASSSPHRFLCFDPHNKDDISVDSVFEPRSEMEMVQPDRSPISLRSVCDHDDSGVKCDSSATSPAQSAQNTWFPCLGSAQSLSSSVSGRRRIRMGVSDIINPPPMSLPVYVNVSPDRKDMLSTSCNLNVNSYEYI